MKKIGIMLFSAFVISSCAMSKKGSLIAHVSIVDKINPSTLMVDSGNFYSVKINLTNKTDSILHFWTMSCSWQENWVSEDYSIKFYIYCRKNVPKMELLEPNQTISYDGIIELIDTTSNIGNKDYRLGFVLIRKNESNNIIDFDNVLHSKINAKKNIFWSEPFRIDK